MMDAADEKQLRTFCERSKLNFRDLALLQTALTHSSFAKKHPGEDIDDNERLEFFGDAVLKLVVSEYLYEKYPGMNEGKLTKLRSQLISDKHLALIARELNIGAFMRFSFGEKNSGGDTRASNLANALEAVLGAIHIDQGMAVVKDFLIPLLEKNTDRVQNLSQFKDFKSQLQEYIQQQRLSLPDYTIKHEEGPDHDKTFHVEVAITSDGERHTCQASGRTKKDAEQAAAGQLLKRLRANRKD